MLLEDMDMRVLRTIVIGYGLLLLLMYLLQDFLLFHPQPLSTEAARLQQLPGVHPVSLRMADGVTLSGWWVESMDAQAPTAIYFGGNAEEVSWMVPEVSAHPGVHWLIVNYRGWGNHPGQPSEAALCGDALAWFDWLQHQPKVKRIVAVGRSLGSGVATHLAAKRPLQGVVLITPFDSVRAVAQRQYPWLPVRWLLKHPFDSLAAAPSVRAPLLMLPALADTVIAPAHARTLFEAWGGDKQWRPLTGVGHNDVQLHPDFWPAMNGFMRGLR